MFKPNILVVDDERFFTSLIADILKESYHISIAVAATEKIKPAHHIFMFNLENVFTSIRLT
jgi:DNA-binding NarL/FixJ family response regulator